MRSNQIGQKETGQRGFSLLETGAAIVLIGIGIYLVTKTQIMTRKSGYSNSNLMLAGHLIGEELESIRLNIAQDTNTNWPPVSVGAVTTKGITLIRTVSNATSPKDGATLSRVRKVDIVTFWGATPRASLDTLRVSTYVSKRF